MLELPPALSPIPTPEPEETAREGSLALDDATLESAAVAEPEPEPEAEDARILRGWNASLATMSELHEARPALRQECFQQLEDWLRRWEVLDVSSHFSSSCSCNAR